MRICAAPTLLNSAHTTVAARAVQTTLQALVFSEILKPLARGLGPVGEIAAESIATRLFVPAAS